MASLLDLPDELLLRLFTFIPTDPSLLRVALTCRRTAALLDDEELWMGRGSRRCGKLLMESGREGPADARFQAETGIRRRTKDVYKLKSPIHTAALLSPITPFAIAQLDTGHWFLEQDSRSPTGGAATLRDVWWLELHATLDHVPPGIHLPLFHISFSSYAMNLTNVRVEIECWIPPPDNISQHDRVASSLLHMSTLTDPISLATSTQRPNKFSLPTTTARELYVRASQSASPSRTAKTPSLPRIRLAICLHVYRARRMDCHRASNGVGQHWRAFDRPRHTSPVVEESTCSSRPKSRHLAVHHAIARFNIWAFEGTLKTGLRVAGLNLFVCAKDLPPTKQLVT
ncbi:hypothetical protein M427DRAFT_64855 [Gonapodya prolifera JEL478]|uniref:F-box domain-containing protein n=1 Tax=Gonapodya prolifera (strain JEL478) TaxID=1344416 RepID=A0A138ZX09_GONPJ|nr:hypothetical protein M427DRAFT_64855 [Gonapodya prolifera JEL478]|eukprot:KXS09049.1 hypothetical protein M427DRAFT_64855 [Gonapodya prolifera JEL478]